MENDRGGEPPRHSSRDVWMEAIEQRTPALTCCCLTVMVRRLAGTSHGEHAQQDDSVSLSTPRRAGPDGIVSSRAPIIAKGVQLPDVAIPRRRTLLGGREFQGLIAHAIIIGGALDFCFGSRRRLSRSRGYCHRLSSSARRSQEIMHGGSSRRLPTRGTGDNSISLSLVSTRCWTASPL